MLPAPFYTSDESRFRNWLPSLQPPLIWNIFRLSLSRLFLKQGITMLPRLISDSWFFLSLLNSGDFRHVHHGQLVFVFHNVDA